MGGTSLLSPIGDNHMRPWNGFLLCLTLAAPALAESPWVQQSSGTNDRLRGVSVVNDQVAWASGNHSTCLRTVDGGQSWEKRDVTHEGDLDFRDIEAIDADHAYVLSIGDGNKGQIHRTHDGGKTWYHIYKNEDPRRFLDAIAFWDVDHGLALSDPVDGRFVVLATDDGGKHWEVPSGPGTMPASLPGEGAFAASGTCLIINRDGHAWFATGGGSVARVFTSADRGRSWIVAETPVRAGSPSRGIFSLAENGLNLAALGGDYKAETDGTGNFAWSGDGGQSWSNARLGSPTIDRPGLRSAAAFVPHQADGLLLTVGPAGSDAQTGTEPWKSLVDPVERDGWHALAVAPSGRFAWAVGEGGKIGRLEIAEAIKAK